MRKIFIIHENTSPIMVANKFIQLATDYVCCVGYIHTDEEKDPDETYGYGEVQPVYACDDAEHYSQVELNQYIPGLWFDTYEEGCKVLATVLQARMINEATIRSTYEELAEKYPEALI